MIINGKGNNVIISEIEEFSLDETFNCGQCFRWNKKGEKYYGIAMGRVVCVYFDGKDLVIENTTAKEANSIWVKYFDLDRNYNIIKEQISKLSPVIAQACNSFSGIRILSQDYWETLCSFIISQNNNIPRIKGIIYRLCENFGEKIDEKNFAFPSAEALSKLTEDDLKVIRSGFRDKYILDAAQKVSSGAIDLGSIREMPIKEARDCLVKIKGVGPKVAECTLLYGFHRLDAFPVDVWMKRVIKEFFPDKHMEFFGEYAGIVQQYLFYYIRNKHNKH